MIISLLAVAVISAGQIVSATQNVDSSNSVSNEEKTSKKEKENTEELKVTAKEVKEKIKQKFEDKKIKGKNWLDKQESNKNIRASLTLNEKKTLNNAIKMAEDNNLDIQQWSLSYKLGSKTATSVFSKGDNQSIKEAKKEFKKKHLGSLNIQIKSMKEVVNNKENPESVRNQAAKKLENLKESRKSFKNEKTKMVYGLQVKSKAKNIDDIVSKNKVALVSKGENQKAALRKDVPQDWLERAEQNVKNAKK